MAGIKNRKGNDSSYAAFIERERKASKNLVNKEADAIELENDIVPVDPSEKYKAKTAKALEILGIAPNKAAVKR